MCYNNLLVEVLMSSNKKNEILSHGGWHFSYTLNLIQIPMKTGNKICSSVKALTMSISSNVIFQGEAVWKQVAIVTYESLEPWPYPPSKYCYCSFLSFFLNPFFLFLFGTLNLVKFAPLSISPLSLTHKHIHTQAHTLSSNTMKSLILNNQL